MNSLEEALEVLSREVDLAMPARKAFLASSDIPPRNRLLERVSREALFREKIDAACIEYARTLQWPEMTKEEVIYAHDRMIACHTFGRWLHDSLPVVGERAVQLWLAWLLVDCWRESVFYRWREQVNDKTFPEWL